MKALFQLVREFWLPLILAAAWTVFNFVDRPLVNWTFRESLNVFGPTFFFISWLVAQWFRVQKQQRIDDGLSELSRGMQAIHAPLLPVRLFLSLRSEASIDRMEQLFGGVDGYKAFGPDKPMPPPPLGLPSGEKDGRILWANGSYVDYEGGVVVGAGVFNMGHPGYNTFHRAIQFTVASLAPDLVLSKAPEDPVLISPSVRVELFLDGKPRSGDVKPSLVLVHGEQPQLVAVRALDSTIVADHAVHLVPRPADQGRSWSVRDLEGTYVRVTLKFLYIKPFCSLSSESWPTIHNLQLWLGPNADSVLSFSLDQLTSQSTTLDPEPVGGDAECVRATFDYLIDRMAYEKCLLSAG